MKAVCVDLNAIAAGCVSLPRVSLYADSAIGRDVMPLFIPDILGGWTGRVCPAWRIERLGKNIPERFALRYADAVGLVLLIRPTECLDAYIASGAASIMDSAVTTGRWLPFDGTPSPLQVEVNGLSREIGVTEQRLAERISAVSSLATIKSGDLIIAADAGVDVPLVPDTYVHCRIGGEECLRVKVK